MRRKISAFETQFNLISRFYKISQRKENKYRITSFYYTLRNHITFRVKSEDITNRLNLTLKLYHTRRSLPMGDQRKSSLGMESTGEATVNIAEMTNEQEYNK